MNEHKQIIERFYSAFQRLDYKTMNDCYSDDIIFSDPVFLILKGDEVALQKCKRLYIVVFGNCIY